MSERIDVTACEDLHRCFASEYASALTAERERADKAEADNGRLDGERRKWLANSQQQHAEIERLSEWCRRFEGAEAERDDLTRKLAEAERQAGVWLNATADEKLKNKALMEAMRKIADTPAWGAPDRWETTPAEVRQFARASLPLPHRSPPMTDPTPEEIEAAAPDGKAREIAWLTGQLRHAYAHLVNGTVGDLKDFADGLLAPAIRSLEAMPSALRSARREAIEEAAKLMDNWAAQYDECGDAAQYDECGDIDLSDEAEAYATLIRALKDKQP